MTDRRNSIQRRSFLKAAAGVTLVGPLVALADRAARSPGSEADPSVDPAAPVGPAAPVEPPDCGQPTALGYGELVPARDRATGLELLKLPRGFEYVTFGWTGDAMSDGTRTPSNHDGMAAFSDGDRVRLIRNHEKSDATPFAPADATYDALAGGGTTTLVFDPDAGNLVEDYASLSGTIRNCAGGPRPAGTWLTCEETTQVNGTTRHGYVFEVPATGLAAPVPLRDMGRFAHEATATDPDTGNIYETEDAGSSALYRYLPRDPANLAAGGELQAMTLEGHSSTVSWTSGTSAGAGWVTVDNPDWGPGEPTCWQQAQSKGAARIIRGEGAWHGNGVIYVVSTSGGPAGQGQVFAYDPVAEVFTCIFASPSAEVINAPDNICVSPRGGLVLCEDGNGREYLHGLTPDGEVFPFAENTVRLSSELRDAKGYGGTDYTGSEWAGATFDPSGSWLFANVYHPGITFAITGPWCEGAL